MKPNPSWLLEDWIILSALIAIIVIGYFVTR